jgi:hypothetical protein
LAWTFSTVKFAAVGGRVTANGSGLDVPPPGAGVCTVTVAVPAAAKSAAGTCACNCVVLPAVVGSGVPFHCTTESPTKFPPVTVKVIGVMPVMPPEGESAVKAGTGLELIVNGSALDRPPFKGGFSTVMLTVPALVRSAVGIVACKEVGLTRTVASATPFHWTTEEASKFVPATERVKGPFPGVTEDGVRAVTVGAGTGGGVGTVIVKTMAFEVPPSVDGLDTVTFTEPAGTRSEAGN